MNKTIIDKRIAPLEEQFSMEANIRDKNKIPILIHTEEFYIYFAEKKDLENNKLADSIEAIKNKKIEQNKNLKCKNLFFLNQSLIAEELPTADEMEEFIKRFKSGKN